MIELSSDSIKDISEDDKNSSEKPSVPQVPEKDSTVPTVGATDKTTDNEIPTDPASEAEKEHCVNEADTKGEENAQINNDEASTEGAEEEKVTDAPKTSEETAPKGEVQNNCEEIALKPSEAA